MLIELFGFEYFPNQGYGIWIGYFENVNMGNRSLFRFESVFGEIRMDLLWFNIIDNI